jgi:two-component SAPR family response regulator
MTKGSKASSDRVFIQIQVDQERKTRFAEKVRNQGKTITEVLISWIDDYLDESEKVDVMDLKKRIEALERKSNQQDSLLMGELLA